MEKVFTVSITGDIDTFDRENKSCLKEYFNVLDQYDIKCTIPVTAEAVRNYPNRANYIIERGHEISGHGDVHIPFLEDINTQIKRLDKMIDIINKYTGYRIQGFRSPYIEANRNLYSALKKVGLKYDSTKKIFGFVCKYIPYYNKKYIDGFGYKYLKSFFRLSGGFYNYINKRSNSPYLLKGITEIPVIGDSDYTLINKPRGPRYNKNESRKIANVWLEHVKILRKTTSAVAIQIHPGRVSPDYLESLDYFCNSCIKNGIKFATLINIYNKFKE